MILDLRIENNTYEIKKIVYDNAYSKSYKCIQIISITKKAYCPDDSILTKYDSNIKSGQYGNAGSSSFNMIQYKKCSSLIKI